MGCEVFDGKTVLLAEAFAKVGALKLRQQGEEFAGSARLWDVCVWQHDTAIVDPRVARAAVVAHLTVAHRSVGSVTAGRVVPAAKSQNTSDANAAQKPKHGDEDSKVCTGWGLDQFGECCQSFSRAGGV